MTVPTIAIAPNITEYFQEVTSDAIRVQKVEATDAATSYLVSLLCSFTHPDEAAVAAAFAARSIDPPTRLGTVTASGGVTLEGAPLVDVGWRH